VRPSKQFAAAAAAVAFAISTLAACGVPIDDSPRAISRTTMDPRVDDSRVTPTTSDSPGAVRVTAYFIGDNRLVGVPFPVDDAPTLPEVLGFTLGDPPRDLTTALPAGTRILSAEVADDIATVDISRAINDISGQTQKQAYAQLAFTTFDFTTVGQVRFQVEGKNVDAPTDNGNKAVVTAEDYPALRPGLPE